MKEQRLKTLNDCLSAIQEAHDVLEEVRDEEQEYIGDAGQRLA